MTVIVCIVSSAAQSALTLRHVGHGRAVWWTVAAAAESY